MPSRILRDSKHSSKAAARGGTSSLPAALRKVLRKKIDVVGFVRISTTVYKFELFWYIFTGRDAGREDVPPLAASVPEC